MNEAKSNWIKKLKKKRKRLIKERKKKGRKWLK